MRTSDLWTSFRQTVGRHPDRPALLCGERAWTFADWASRAEEFRGAYARAGVGRGDRVLLWLTNTFEMAAALTAAWGQAAIPALLDSNSRAPQLRHAIGKTRPKVLVLARDGALPCDCPGLTSIVAEDVGRRGSTLAGDSASTVVPTDPASIVFTSGSTGSPKGVVQSHGNLIRGCHSVAAYLGYRDSDVLLCPVPWSFDYGYGHLLSTIVLGVTQVIPRAFNPFGVCEAIERHRPDILVGLPALFSCLMGGLSPIRSTDRSSIRLLTNTGGSIPYPVLQGMFDTFEESAIVLNYGLTETYRSCFLPPQLVREVRGSIGVPIPGVDIAIVSEDGRVAEQGEEGQIVHRGDYICLGYWDDADATARAIRRDPLALDGSPDSGRALFTGDYGYRGEDGLLYFRGRKDHLLKSMGIRVSPTEVESLLYESHLVSEAAVFGMPHDLLGHEVCAAVVPRDGGLDLLRQLTAYAKRVMTQPMLPRRYFVKEALPRTTTGKVDYCALQRDAVGVDHSTVSDDTAQ